MAHVRLLNPYVRTKHLEMLFSVETNCQGVTAIQPPFEVGGWDNGTQCCGFYVPSLQPPPSTAPDKYHLTASQP